MIEKRRGKKCISLTNCFNHIWNASNIPFTATITKVLNLPFSIGGVKLDSFSSAFSKGCFWECLSLFFLSPGEKWMYFGDYLHTLLIIWFSLKDLLLNIANRWSVIPIPASLTSLEWWNSLLSFSHFRDKDLKIPICKFISLFLRIWIFYSFYLNWLKHFYSLFVHFLLWFFEHFGSMFLTQILVDLKKKRFSFALSILIFFHSVIFLKKLDSLFH